ncbi:MAG: NAD(P)/FAD-dependent oxidoreductase [Pseudomonadota bacterium]
MPTDHVVAIVGGGPAGLSAALTLARANIRSVVFDAPAPARNAASAAIGNLPGHDGIAPSALRETIRIELSGYGLTEFHTADVVNTAGALHESFTVTPSTGDPITVSRIILACGRVDLYPNVDGFSEYWGRSIHNCPYCGGYDDRNTPWGVVVNRPEMTSIIEIYRMWSDDLIVFMDPDIEMDDARKADLTGKGIGVETTPIRRIVGNGERIHGVELADGRTVQRAALIWWPRMTVPPIVADLRLALSDQGEVVIDDAYRSSRSGIYATGDLIYSNHQSTASAIHLGGACAASVVFDIAMAQ